MTNPHVHPVAALEGAAARQTAEEQALRALVAARCRLVLGKDARSVFFAALALRLTPRIDWLLDTMATDGKQLVINPQFVLGLSPDELVGVVAHEVMHNALAHHARRDLRDAERWNIACDLAINPLLQEAGFELPACRLMPGEAAFSDLPPGKSAEEYYGLLPELASKRQIAEPEQGGVPDPGGCGGVTEPAGGSQAEARQSVADWESAVAQARQVAEKRGTLPAGLARLVEEVVQPRIEWRDVLRVFICRQARNDYCWSPPNRRFVHVGFYLPGLRSEELGEVLLAIDTSGSIGPKELASFAAEASGILEAFDCSLTVLYHDSMVQKVQRWHCGDGP